VSHPLKKCETLQKDLTGRCFQTESWRR